MKDYPKTDMYEIIDTIGVPHMYCITNKHVVYASDNCSGRLNNSTIKEYENKMGKGCCGMNGCSLTIDEHEAAAVVQVDFDGEVKDAPGIKEYLEKCMPNLEKKGHAGFVFVQKENENND